MIAIAPRLREQPAREVVEPSVMKEEPPPRFPFNSAKV